MFRCGDKVLYGSQGICEIVDVEIRRVDHRSIEYFVLQPLEQTNSRFYIPTQNSIAVSKLRPILTPEEINALLTEELAKTNAWIEDEGKRKQYYKELISSGDRAALIRMVHALHLHRREQEDAGRKFHLCDDNFLRDAEKLLSAEFALVLNIRQDEVGAYIQNILNC
jgi:CarD family transcriptional regulator